MPGSSTGVDAQWDRLLRFGGFPEPFIEQDPAHHQRWSMRRRELLVRGDLRDITEIKLVELVEHLYLLLPERVGSPLSINNLKESLQVAYNSVAVWLTALERLYICFRLSPYHRKLARSLRKEQKLYLWDWSQVKEPGARFENMVACHLLKSVHAWNDLGLGDFDLRYWRNKEKEEVDFVVTNNQNPVALFECKLTETKAAKALVSLGAELGGIPALQLVAPPGVDFRSRSVRVVSAKDYLTNLI